MPIFGHFVVHKNMKEVIVVVDSSNLTTRLTLNRIIQNLQRKPDWLLAVYFFIFYLVLSLLYILIAMILINIGQIDFPGNGIRLPMPW